ncbi:hypothetical protein QZH41_012761 [Actinostola sp. cb2023]|nr:hypothetical protein QZH41_012761 [Actinostola sp. cb2023]
MDYAQWIEAGTRFELSGKELQEYVDKKEKQYLEREERAKEREHEQKMREEEMQFKVLELTAATKEMSYKSELELLQAKVEADLPSSMPSEHQRRPKMPCFDEQKDDMDTFLERFERYARVQKWTEDSWAVSLSLLLTGKGLQVYTSIPQECAEDYPVLKAALLKRYELTEEGFRNKFRQCKPEKGETVFQFISRLSRYFKRWTELSDISKTFNALQDLIIREQFLLACSTDMALFLRERVPKDMTEMTKLAEQFMEAHGGSVSNTKPPIRRVDTSSAAIKEDLVEQDQLTGKEHWCVLIDGTIRRFDMARVFVDTPFYTGTIEAMCMKEPVYDLVIGNIAGARISPDASWKPTTTEIVITVGPEMPKQAKQDEVTVVKRRKDEEIELADSPKTPSGICEEKGGKEDKPADTPKMQSIAHEDLIVDQAAVTTRAEAEKQKRDTKPLKVKREPKVVINQEKLKQAQAEDITLKQLREWAQDKKQLETKGGNTFRIEIRDGIMYREFRENKGDYERTVSQVVIPLLFRDYVMSLAHESLMGGHLGTKKTLDRIRTNFHWPGMSKDVKVHLTPVHFNKFCMSCDICQKTIPKGKVPKVPLGEMPIIEEPFYRIAVDLMGPLAPVSERGHRYILTVVDYATRYPEAIPLRRIDTVSVADALLEVFSRVGFPNEILSDLGTQFTSDLMREICRLVAVKQLFTTPYNPKCNGLTERINGVIKTMVKRMCQERPKDWDRYLPAVLFAYREVPQASTGFAPFELLYGRTVRGPMQALKELWVGSQEPEERNAYQYVLELRQKLEDTCKIARESLYQAQGKYKHYYDKKTTHRSFVVGDLVLLLLPTEHNKLTLQWKGPYKVSRVLNRMDYEVDKDGKFKVYHANLLKRYHDRKEDVPKAKEDLECCSAGIAVIEENDVSDDEGNADLLKIDYVNDEECLDKVKIGPDINEEQRKQVQTLF